MLVRERVVLGRIIGEGAYRRPKQSLHLPSLRHVIQLA
jgi:hypothetical protein